MKSCNRVAATHQSACESGFLRRTCGLIIALVLGTCAPSNAAEMWVMRDGSVTFYPDLHALDRYELSIEHLGDPATNEGLTDAIDGRGLVSFTVDAGIVSEVVANHVGFERGIRVTASTGMYDVYELRLQFDETLTATRNTQSVSSTLDSVVLDVHHVRAGFNPRTGSLSMPSPLVTISPVLATELGDDRLAGVAIGRLVLRGIAEWDGGDVPAPTERDGTRAIGASGGVAGGVVGPDMTFCELYGLRQFGRDGDVVGLALTTTSWNVGNADLMWFAPPREAHPVIAMNLYRAHGGRFEQIGQSWLKHGFFALDSEQCGTSCTYESGHGEGDWLGVGCTDTYSSSLNASQSGLGPRYEVNPWTGEWVFDESHFDGGFHSHDDIEHRLQVHDADFDPGRYAGAAYYAEGYYVIRDDTDVMNSASWKPVGVTAGGGGFYSFDMTGPSTRPSSGFAIDAWAGARQTMIAPEVPPIEFVSPDGRCILAVQTEDLGDGFWHYEYALLNIDLDQKVGSFSIPLTPGTNVSRIGFHAVESHGEPYSNDPWTSTVSGNAITWTTIDNPLRWGTIYNFRFKADAPPADTQATLGLFDVRSPRSLTGVTTGPMADGGLCDVVDAPGVEEPAIAKSRYLSIVPGSDGAITAIRLTITSLLGDSPTGSVAGNQPDFAGFEGEVRWVGPPDTYPEGSTAMPTFAAAPLQCDPYFMDWSAIDVLHIFGAEIIPDSTYDVQRIHVDCEPALTEEANYSTPLTVYSGKWGDVVSPFAGDGDGAAQPDFSDIAAMVTKFTGSVDPLKSSAQMQPNILNPADDISFADIANVVDAFTGGAYPHAGPVACP